MSWKRHKAKCALLEWFDQTNAEKFVSEHKGIQFRESDSDVKVELLSHKGPAMSEFKEFESKFDEWWEENYINVSADRTEAFDIYSLGIKHQQEKVEKAQTNSELLSEAFQRSVAREEELQKRVDAVVIEIEKLYLSGVIGFGTVKKLEQALKGGGTTNLNIDEKGECRHFSTTMFFNGKAECFHCDAVVNEEREVIGKQSKGFSWTGKEYEK